VTRTILTAFGLIAAAGTGFAQWGPVDTLVASNTYLPSIVLNNARCIAAQRSVVHLVWSDDRDNDWEIYYKRSSDRGASWSADTRLTHSTGTSTQCAIATTDSLVHIIWRDNRDGSFKIYYARSTDQGLDWEPEVPLAPEMPYLGAHSIAAAGPNVHIVWDDTTSGHLAGFYKRSTDAGLTWDASRVLTSESAYSGHPAITAQGPNVHVVWTDTRTGNGEIFYKHSPDNGTTWTGDTNLVNNPWPSDWASVAACDSDVHIIWYDHRGDDMIYYRRSTNNGRSWQPEYYFSAGYSDNPTIVAAHGTAHVVWLYAPSTIEGTYYDRSTDRGAHWEVPVELGGAYMGSTPAGQSLAVSDSVVHAVWVDIGGTGTRVLCYRRNLTGNPVGITELPTAPRVEQVISAEPDPFVDHVVLELSTRVGRLPPEILVLDGCGRLIRTLSLSPTGQRPSGTSAFVTWDGRDRKGVDVREGCYFCIPHGGAGFVTRKLLRIK
jgi:hypothetical protein